jgi:hypothetical protein
MEEWSSGRDAREGLAAKCDGMGVVAAIADQDASALRSLPVQAHPPSEDLAADPADSSDEEVSALRSDRGAREWCRGGAGGMKGHHALLSFFFSRLWR